MVDDQLDALTAQGAGPGAVETGGPTSPRRRRSGLARRFLADERGAITTDMVTIFLPIFLIILTVFEIGISFYILLSAQKAAQMGVRFIASENPLHTQVPLTNTINFANGKFGDSCYQPSGNHACVDPGGPWACDGAALAGDCDGDGDLSTDDGFTRLVKEMQIVYPSLTEDLVEVSYSYEELGFAGGPFQPKIEVTVKARPSPIQILSLVDLIEGFGGSDGTVRLREVTASVFGGDLNSLN